MGNCFQNSFSWSLNLKSKKTKLAISVHAMGVMRFEVTGLSKLTQAAKSARMSDFLGEAYSPAPATPGARI